MDLGSTTYFRPAQVAAQLLAAQQLMFPPVAIDTVSETSKQPEEVLEEPPLLNTGQQRRFQGAYKGCQRTPQ
eukprot:3822890-Amphidinium_carterae.1